MSSHNNISRHLQMTCGTDWTNDQDDVIPANNQDRWFRYYLMNMENLTTKLKSWYHYLVYLEVLVDAENVWNKANIRGIRSSCIIGRLLLSAKFTLHLFLIKKICKYIFNLQCSSNTSLENFKFYAVFWNNCYTVHINKGSQTRGPPNKMMRFR